MKLRGLDFVAALHEVMMRRIKRGSVCLHVGCVPDAVVVVKHSLSLRIDAWTFPIDAQALCVDDACERVRRNLR